MRLAGSLIARSSINKFIIGVVLCGVVALPRFFPSVSNSTQTVDYKAYYWASQAVERGETPYAPFDAYGQPLPRGARVGTQFVYPPTLLAVLHPIARYPFHVQERIWLVLQVLCGALGLTLLLLSLVKFGAVPQLTIARLLMFSFLAISPLYYNYATGQLDVLLLPLFVLALTFIWEKPLYSGLCLGSLLLIKHSALYAVIPFLFVGKGQFVKGLSISAFGIFMLSLTVTDIQTWTSFIQLQVSGSEALVTLPPANDVFNVGISGVVSRLGGNSVSLTALIGVVCLVGVGWWIRDKPKNEALPWLFASIVLSFLILPRFWPQHIMLLLPVIVYQVFTDIEKRGLHYGLALSVVLWMALVPGFILSKVLLKLGVSLSSEWMSSILTMAILAIFIIRSFVFYVQNKEENETSII